MKPSLEKSIVCSNLDNFRLVLKKLTSLNYVDTQGSILDTIGLSEYHFNLGLKVINLYDNKTVKYAADSKKSKNSMLICKVYRKKLI